MCARVRMVCRYVHVCSCVCGVYVCAHVSVFIWRGMHGCM